MHESCPLPLHACVGSGFWGQIPESQEKPRTQESVTLSMLQVENYTLGCILAYLTFVIILLNPEI